MQTPTKSLNLTYAGTSVLSSQKMLFQQSRTMIKIALTVIDISTCIL